MGRVRGASSLVTKVDVFVAVNAVVAAAASASSPSSMSCNRGIDGVITHGRCIQWTSTLWANAPRRRTLSRTTDFARWAQHDLQQVGA